jgi:hypothetical protein
MQMKRKIMRVLVIIAFVFPLSVYAQSNTLIGKWEFWSGDAVYFFWESDNIEFKSDETVHNYDDEESGKYTAIGGERLRIWSDDGDTYDFIYDIKENNMLTVTDEDHDTAIFKRVR